jgi:hypothetical protein
LTKKKHNYKIKLFFNAVKPIEKWLNLTIKQNKIRDILFFVFDLFLRFHLEIFTKKTNAPFLNGFRGRWNHFIDSTDLKTEISQKSKQTEN